MQDCTQLYDKNVELKYDTLPHSLYSIHLSLVPLKTFFNRNRDIIQLKTVEIALQDLWSMCIEIQGDNIKKINIFRIFFFLLLDEE